MTIHNAGHNFSTKRYTVVCSDDMYDRGGYAARRTVVGRERKTSTENFRESLNKRGKVAVRNLRQSISRLLP